MSKLFQAAIVFILSVWCLSASADEGNPVAVRAWPGGFVTIETHWGLSVSFDAKTPANAREPVKVDQELAWPGDYDHVLRRAPNAEKPTWARASEEQSGGSNDVRVSTLTLADGKVGVTEVSVDGVRIVFASSSKVRGNESSVKNDAAIDLLVLTASSADDVLEDSVTEFVQKLGAKQTLINMEDMSPEDLDKFAKNVGAESLAVAHNTLALNSTSAVARRVVTLGTKPWEMPDELEELFTAMEKSNAASQETFAKLSVGQMNFKPKNGTHTPRWNTEHMMGRQLLFFSKIYHTQDSAIPAMDLNPKQMPPDYEFAHPDWDGKEEARQMQRVSDFTRRFAYLLDGMDVDKKAPGSRWPSLRALLRQMERHYKEHTGNTVKKFELPDWPSS